MKKNNNPHIIKQKILINDLNKVASTGIANQLIPRVFRNSRRHRSKCSIERIHSCVHVFVETITTVTIN